VRRYVVHFPKDVKLKMEGIVIVISFLICDGMFTVAWQCRRYCTDSATGTETDESMTSWTINDVKMLMPGANRNM
jgi:hypothetical protein